MALTAEQNEVIQALADLIKKSSGIREPIVGVDKVAEKQTEKQKLKANQELLKANQELIKTLKKYENVKELSSEQFDEIAAAAEKASVELDDLVDSTTLTVKSFDDLQTETTQLSDVIDKTTKQTGLLSKSISKTTDLYNKHSARIKQSFGLFVEENRIMRERSAADANYLDAMWELGISMKDWTTILADNRATQQAMASGGRDFTKELIVGQKEIVNFSRDNTQAAKTTAQFAKNITGFGVNQKNLGGAMDEQISMYKDNFQIWGMTAEAFGKSTEALLADTDIRNNLSIMAEKERKQYILGVQAQESYRMSLGYTEEQARELTKTFAKMAGESPKERMKKAAKQRAMMGALGMGAEGAELQQLMVNINQLQGQEKADAQARIEEIQRAMSNALQQKYGQGLASEMAFRAMADKTGVTEMSRNMETLTKEAQKRDKELAKDSMKDRKIPGAINEGIKILDTIKNIQYTSVGILGLILLSLTKGPILRMLGKGFGAIKGGGGAAGKAILKGGAAAAGMVQTGAAGAAKGVMKGGAAAAGAVKTGASISKTAMKSGIKKVPIIGALAGIGFGISRAMSGDWLGAAGEVASGVASIIPGVGTAASIGIDTALAARDIANANDGIGRSENKAATTSTELKEGNTQQENTKLLISTLQELQTYMKSVNNQNDKMASSLSNTSDVLSETLRWSKTPDPQRSS